MTEENIKLFDSELKVMDVLWKDGDVPAKYVADTLNREVGWNKNTTYTLIKRCINKGAIERTEPGFMCHALIAKEQVQDEFSKGSYCSELYEEVYRAKVSLCDRLGVQEDNDIETIMSNLTLIGRHLSMKMFDYGMDEAQKEAKTHI